MALVELRRRLLGDEPEELEYGLDDLGASDIYAARAESEASAPLVSTPAPEIHVGAVGLAPDTLWVARTDWVIDFIIQNRSNADIYILVDELQPLADAIIVPAMCNASKDNWTGDLIVWGAAVGSAYRYSYDAHAPPWRPQ